MRSIGVYLDDRLSLYSFGTYHPFNEERYFTFKTAFLNAKLNESTVILKAKQAREEDIALFHTMDYINTVKDLSESGEGELDPDTPAYKGVYDASCWIAGSVLDATDRLMNDELYHAFVPIGGLHHAFPDRGAGFCVFNDCGIAIKHLQKHYGLKRIAYVDIDVHHGDGIYYSFIEDPNVLIVDIHQAPLFPGTGRSDEMGVHKGFGFKRNFTLQPFSGDQEFMVAWRIGLDFLKQHKPDFIILQCGADGLGGDPLAQLALSEETHARVTKDLSALSKHLGHHRLLALGGGGYNNQNTVKAWIKVVRAMI